MQTLEPHKCDGWHWKTWQEIKFMAEKGDELFLPVENLVRENQGIEQMVMGQGV
jgi:8-oxo-dGTP diphosphatase